MRPSLLGRKCAREGSLALRVHGGVAVEQIALARIDKVAEIAKGSTRRLAMAASDDG